MNIAALASKTKKLLSDNSPVILTAIGVTGTITTAVLAAKASFKASDIWDEAEVQKNKDRILEGRDTARVPLEKKEKIELVWKLYVPAIVSGATTITCIIAANYVGTKQAAALAAAVSVSEKALEEYKTKTKEIVGPVAEQEIRDELDKDRQAAAPLVTFLDTNNDVLFLDASTGRYFMCNKETIRRAVNDINYQILHSDSASVSDFYKKVGLEPTSMSDEIGWNSEHPLEIDFTCHETPDGKPCMAFEFMVVPVRNFWQV